MDISTRGLVLREVNYRDADKILTVLTESEGRLTVSARGVKRKNSKFTAASQLLAYSDMSLYQRLDKYYLREARAVELFQGLRSDIALLALGSYFAELLEAVSDEDSQNPEILELGLSALYILSKNDRPQELVKAAFELRLMCLAGYEPLLDYCPACKTPIAEAEAAGVFPEEKRGLYFNLSGGTVICGSCRGVEEYTALCRGSYLAMKYIAGAVHDKVFAFALGEKALRKLETVSEKYMISRLERGFRTLDYWKGIR